MKRSVILALMAAAPSLYAQEQHMLELLPGSTFELNGTSNVNRFSCEIDDAFANKRIPAQFEQNASCYFFKNTSFSLAAKNFDCHNARMTRDLKATLKVNSFPEMEFELIRVSPQNSREGTAVILLTIAGTSRQYCLPYRSEFSTEYTHNIVVVDAVFDIRDFNIEPPTALMGLIRVDHLIRIELNLRFSLL